MSCPICHLEIETMAISRVDNKTKICRFCGSAEGKDPIAVKITKEELEKTGHKDYACYLKELRAN